MMVNVLSVLMVFIIITVNLRKCFLCLGTIDNTVFSPPDNPVKQECHQPRFSEKEMKAQKGYVTYRRLQS